jgi:hypothetical protein
MMMPTLTYPIGLLSESRFIGVLNVPALRAVSPISALNGLLDQTVASQTSFIPQHFLPPSSPHGDRYAPKLSHRESTAQC